MCVNCKAFDHASDLLDWVGTYDANKLNNRVILTYFILPLSGVPSVLTNHERSIIQYNNQEIAKITSFLDVLAASHVKFS